MGRRMEPGDHWKALLVKDTYMEYVKVPQPGGYETRPIRMVTLACECGREVTMPKSEIEELKMKDCGECGLGGRGRAKKKMASTLLALDEHELMEKEAKRLGTTLANLLRTLVKEYVAKIRKGNGKGKNGKSEGESGK